MKSKIAMWMMAMFFFAGVVALAGAQDSPTKGETHMKARTLTGCLQKGDSSNEYNLVAQDGGTWEIKSDSVNLGSHVGHTVTVTGTVANATAHGMKEDAKEEAKEHGMDKSATEHGHMTVTDVSMVSESCQR